MCTAAAIIFIAGLLVGSVLTKELEYETIKRFKQTIRALECQIKLERVNASLHSDDSKK